MLNFKNTLVLLSFAACTPHALAAPANFDPGAQFATADANGDGVLTRSEFLAARSASFPQLDANADGGLSKSELTAAAPKGHRRILAGRMFASFDANKDGKVSAAEFDAGPTPAFDRADADGNGKLEGNELPPAAR